jgi:hypothetical protein
MFRIKYIAIIRLIIKSKKKKFTAAWVGDVQTMQL